MIILLLILFFFHPIEDLLSELAVGFDHVRNEGKDEELDTDESCHARKDDVVEIGSDFEIVAKVLDQKGKEGDEGDRNEDEPGDAKELHGADIAHGFQNNPGAVVDEAPSAFDDARLATLEIGDGDRDPYHPKIFPDGIDNRFLSVGETSRVIEAEEGFAIMRSKTTGDVMGLDIEERADHGCAQTVEEVFDPRNVFGARLRKTVADNHIGLIVEDGVNQLLNFIGIKLAIGIDIDHDIGSFSEGVFTRGGEHHSQAAIKSVTEDKVGPRSLGDFTRPICRTIIHDLDKNFIDTAKSAGHMLDCVPDDRFFIVGRDIDDEAHNSILNFKF